MRGNLDYFRLLQEARRGSFEPADKALRLAVLADCATQQLVPLLRVLFSRERIHVEVYEGPFDAVELEARNPESAFYEFKPDVVVILNSVQMLRDKYYERRRGAGNFREAAFAKIVGAWSSIAANSQATLIQSTFVSPIERMFGNYDMKVPDSFTSTVSWLNGAIAAESRVHGHVLLLDADATASWAGRRTWFDERLWALGKSLCSFECLPVVAQNIVDITLATQGRTVKCVVVDLDNTLWGGVVGDEGPHAITIGAHGEGEPFYRLQCFLRELKERGILLAVCSKNEQANAESPFRQNPEMALPLDDFVAFVANWNNKPDNIRTIRETLNIGLDSMLFLDDNPFERAAVREMLPEVIVPELPEDPADWIKTLCELNVFETASFSAEDTKRSDSYRHEEQRRLAADAAPSFEAFLESLDMTIEVSRFLPEHLGRITQLLQRSNQFNLTTRRHNHAQCEAMMRDSDNCLTLYASLKDRFGDHGLILVVIASVDREARALVITDWVMSCRVLTRGVEEFLMNHLVEEAGRVGAAKILGLYRPTPKNAMVKDFYARFGFEKTKKGDGGEIEWTLAVSSYEARRVFIRPELQPAYSTAT